MCDFLVAEENSASRTGVFEEGSRRVPCIKWSSNLTAQVAIFERILLDAVTVPKDLL